MKISNEISLLTTAGAFSVSLIAGQIYSYNWIKLLLAYWDRLAFLQFAESVKAAIIVADVGRGKSLLMSILARYLKVYGIKKVGFINDIPGVDLLSYADVSFQEKISFREASKLKKYFFVDETNFMIDGTNFLYNRIHHKGVEQLQQITRHLHTILWISATRGNHVWIALRQMVNYYIRLGGVKKLFNFGDSEFFTLNIKFYTQGCESLAREFNILIDDSDFELYDSYWLADMNKFRIRDQISSGRSKLDLKQKIK